MARKRMIDPNIWTDEGFLELSIKAKLLFIGLISNADDEGKGLASAKGLKAKVFPSDQVTIDEIEDIKCEIEENTCVRFYKVEKKEYYKLYKWNSYQRISHKQTSSIPDPQEKNDCGTSVEDVRNGCGVGVEEVRNECGTGEEASPQLINKSINKITNLTSSEFCSEDSNPNRFNCPHQEIINLYHRILPELPKIQQWTPQRQAFLRARWNEKKERQCLKWWQQFFEKVKESDFLMGQVKDFRADLEWLIRPKNFPKVLEGRYENRSPPCTDW